jgi:hypothetical protein
VGPTLPLWDTPYIRSGRVSQQGESSIHIAYVRVGCAACIHQVCVCLTGRAVSQVGSIARRRADPRYREPTAPPPAPPALSPPPHTHALTRWSAVVVCGVLMCRRSGARRTRSTAGERGRAVRSEPPPKTPTPTVRACCSMRVVCARFHLCVCTAQWRLLTMYTAGVCAHCDVATARLQFSDHKAQPTLLATCPRRVPCPHVGQPHLTQPRTHPLPASPTAGAAGGVEAYSALRLVDWCAPPPCPVRIHVGYTGRHVGHLPYLCTYSCKNLRRVYAGQQGAGEPVAHLQ